MKLYSVNAALKNRNQLHGDRIYIEGLLSFEFENISISHWPKAEQEGSGVWIAESNGVFRFNTDALEKFAGKKVVCLGQFQSSFESDMFDGPWGFGHFGLWSAQIVATEIVYYKKWHIANGTSET